MDHLLSDYKNIFPYKTLFFFKYVDNILTALPQDKIIPTLNIMNTHEVEIPKTINFLYLKLYRESQCIRTQWNRKDVKSTRVVNYFSNHPLIYKKNLIYNMFLRSDILSGSEYKDVCHQQIKQLLIVNGYLRHFIRAVRLFH